MRLPIRLAFARIICGVVVQMSWINNKRRHGRLLFLRLFLALSLSLFVCVSVFSIFCIWFDGHSSTCPLSRTIHFNRTHFFNIVWLDMPAFHVYINIYIYIYWEWMSTCLSVLVHQRLIIIIEKHFWSSTCAYTYRHNKTVKHIRILGMSVIQCSVCVHQNLSVRCCGYYRCCCFSTYSTAITWWISLRVLFAFFPL